MKHRKVYLGLLLILGIVSVWFIRDILTAEGVSVGYTVQAEEKPQEWHSLIANEINEKGIKLVVDGNEIDLKDKVLFLDNNMNIIIPESIFTEAFNCSINCFEMNNIHIQKGNTVVTGDIGSEYINIDSEFYLMEYAVQLIEEEIYIQAKIMEKGFAYTYRWDIENNTLYLTDTKKSDSILPSRFSYRDIGRLADVKNQGDLSTCWAFASLTALETRLMPKENYVFSVDNMSKNNGYTGTQYDGGDYTRAMAYLSSWRGPILEADDPYGDGIFAKDLPAQKHVQEMQVIESKNFESIKRAVFLYGGVQSSLFTSMTTSKESSYYYKPSTTSYCYIGTNKPNHDVVIVGWDDNYPKENFNGKLEGNGAFICINSWGNSFGDNGLFYVSYYDSNIGMHNVVYTGVEDSDNYDNIYQSDICGWVGQMGYEEESAYFANVYTSKGKETLEAVSFYATGKNTEYEIYFVDDFEDESSFDRRKFVQKGKFSNMGYYTVKLDTTFDLEVGKDYAVVVKIKTPDSVHPIAIEYKAGESTANVDITDGKGYISLAGRSWEHVEDSKNCNICLKMFTVNN